MVDASDTTLASGALFANRYRVVRLIARGGMGAVFEAVQVDVGLRVALKVMLPHVAQRPKLRAYFEREARVSAHIESDHVAQVLAAGVEPATGEAWMAMEFLDGESLEARLKRGPLAASEARVVFQQLGHALAAAHRVGVVHCDLKPPNVFLARSRREGADLTVKVLDFGIARELQESATSALGTTVAGSPRFMAPEQTRKNGRIKPATDVWALGLLAFNVLTGRLFWRELRDIVPLLREVNLDAIPTASARAREFGLEANLPSGFDSWFGACLTRDVDARPQDVSGVAQQLAELLAPRATARPSIAGTVALSDEAMALHAAVVSFADAERRGDCHEILSLWERSLAHTSMRSQLGPRVAFAYVARAVERERTCDLRGSLADCDHALWLNVNDGVAWYLRSRALRLLGEGPAGIEDLRRAASLGVPEAARELAAIQR